MVFSSISFLFLFFPIVFGIYYILPSIKIKNIFLIIASLVFYAWGEPIYIFLMIISVWFNYKIGLRIEKTETKKTQWLIFAIILNIGILFYFKYAGFFVELVNLLPGMDFAVPEIRLPVGISFFTFQALSYVFDVKRGESKALTSYKELLLYIALFPQLIAGPIVKFHDIASQIKTRIINIDRVASGGRRFIIGLTKKVVIANGMAVIVDQIFAVDAGELNIISAWIGAIAYLFQIYFDFSGYSDMAIGLGRMLGFDFKENFNYPFMSTSIKEFWRRWHISLSTWFREYLYIPLGGNRKGKVRTYINMAIVFFATGLWHGANMTFVVWGALHGLFLILETAGIIAIEKVKWKWVKHVYTLLIVILLFVIFRADSISYGLEYIKVMFTGFDFSVAKTMVGLEFIDVFTVILFILACVGSTNIVERISIKLEGIRIVNERKYRMLERASYVIVMVFFVIDILFLASNAYNPFIYFRF